MKKNLNSSYVLDYCEADNEQLCCLAEQLETYIFYLLEVISHSTDKLKAP